MVILLTDSCSPISNSLSATSSSSSLLSSWSLSLSNVIVVLALLKWHHRRLHPRRMASFWLSSDNSIVYRIIQYQFSMRPWYRHQMETFSALLAICAGNSPVPGEFPTQRPVTRSFDVFFDLRLNKRLSKRSWGWWLETLSRPLWRHRNASKWSCNGMQ